MTGYQSKKTAARDKLDGMERKRGSIALARHLCYEIAGATNGDDDFSGNDYGSVDIAEILSAEVVRLQAALAQPVQEPVGYVYSEAGVKHGAIQRDLPNGTPLYTTPPQRPWVEPRGDEWFNWWRVSKIADETEAEIDFADFIAIALAVSAKLKEENNG
jgi:hypothetical protein